MNMGKCHYCKKTVYQMECYKFGPPTAECVTHKGCFKCEDVGCKVQLNMGSYCYFEGRVTCKAHNAMSGIGDIRASGKITTQDMSMNAALTSPRTNNAVGLMGGQTIGIKPQGSFDMVTSVQKNAPKADVQRGYGVGGAKPQGNADMVMQQQMSAPKQDVVRGVGVGGAKPQGNADMVLQQQMSVPKQDVMRGIGVGGAKPQGNADMVLQQQMGVPKQDVVRGYGAGGGAMGNPQCGKCSAYASRSTAKFCEQCGSPL